MERQSRQERALNLTTDADRLTALLGTAPMSAAETFSDPNPCTRCGACCAHFRVSFYWADALAHGLPEPLYEALTPTLGCMKGTNSKTPRCVALSGEVGQQVACSVYAQRTSPCRELQAGDDKCLRARAAHGLPPL